MIKIEKSEVNGRPGFNIFSHRLTLRFEKFPLEKLSCNLTDETFYRAHTGKNINKHYMDLFVIFAYMINKILHFPS